MRIIIAVLVFGTFLFAMIIQGESRAAGSDGLESSGGARAVSIEDFVPGKSWVWDYFEPLGRIYSSERYEVESVDRMLVTIAMSSAYADESGQLGTYHLHHRIEVDLNHCLAAYRSLGKRRPWTLALYARHGQGKTSDQWVKTSPGTTLAFEEKFNCNPHLVKAPRTLATEFAEFEGVRAFRQQSWLPNAQSWFQRDGAEAGVMLRKIMGRNPKTSFLIKRR